jgi:hypothetical protein
MGLQFALLALTMMKNHLPQRSDTTKRLVNKALVKNLNDLFIKNQAKEKKTGIVKVQNLIS